MRQDDVGNHDHWLTMMQKYSLEFILNIGSATEEEIRGALAGLGENLAIAANQDSPSERRDLKVSIYTDDPALVFDTCSQFGKLKSVKID